MGRGAEMPNGNVYCALCFGAEQALIDILMSSVRGGRLAPHGKPPAPWPPGMGSSGDRAANRGCLSSRVRKGVG